MTYRAALSSPAIRDLDRLPERISAAVVEFIYGPLIEDPGRVGKPLVGRHSGLYSARRGDYRVLYEIDVDRHFVTIVRVAHRASAYRPR